VEQLACLAPPKRLCEGECGCTFYVNGGLAIDVSASVFAKQAGFIIGLRALSETADVG